MGDGVVGSWGGGLRFQGEMAGGQLDLFLGLEAVGAEDALDVSGFGGVARRA